MTGKDVLRLHPSISALAAFYPAEKLLLPALSKKEWRLAMKRTMRAERLQIVIQYEPQTQKTLDGEDYEPGKQSK